MTDETNGRNQKFKEILRKGGENLVKAVDHTNLTIERGKFTAIVGRSGSGKSTMLHLMGGLDRPDKGRVFIDGEDIFKLKDEQLAVFRRKKIGFIFQDYNLLPSLNVWENIVLPLGLDNKKVDHNYVMEIIKTIGIEDKLKIFQCSFRRQKREWPLPEHLLHGLDYSGR